MLDCQDGPGCELRKLPAPSHSLEKAEKMILAGVTLTLLNLREILDSQLPFRTQRERVLLQPGRLSDLKLTHFQLAGLG